MWILREGHSVPVPEAADEGQGRCDGEGGHQEGEEADNPIHPLCPASPPGVFNPAAALQAAAVEEPRGEGVDVEGPNGQPTCGTCCGVLSFPQWTGGVRQAGAHAEASEGAVKQAVCVASMVRKAGHTAAVQHTKHGI